jgi:anhydro-N-acetylmuramic acid kinase
MEQDFEPLIKNSGLAPKDLLATLIEHYALQISQVIRDYSQVENPQVLITGGGAYNSYFIQRLDAHLEGQWNHFQASSELIEFKEALIFGFLGLLRLLGEENCLSSVTGARRNSSGGVIYS